MCCAWYLHGAELSLRQFGTSAELSQLFMKGPKCPTDTSALVPKCPTDTSALVPKCLKIFWRGRSVQRTLRH